MNQEILQTIRHSALTNRVIRIIYREKDGTSEGWRYVEPYSFSYDNGENGLFAWDKSKNGIRRFSLGRIEIAEITEEQFIPRYHIQIR